MSRFQKKIDAFTLTEVMISMAISSVVIMLSYFSYEMLNTYFAKVTRDNEFNSECLSFRLAISRDIEQADYILQNGEALDLYYKTDKTSWYSNADTLVRTSDNDIEKKFYLRPHVTNINKDHKTNYVNQIRVVYFDGSGDSTSFNFYKDYPIATYINQ